MSERDEWGYPLTDVLTEGYHSPSPVSSDASTAQVEAHERAYVAYQERFRHAYMAKIRGRSRGGFPESGS